MLLRRIRTSLLKYSVVADHTSTGEYDDTRQEFSMVQGHLLQFAALHTTHLSMSRYLS